MRQLLATDEREQDVGKTGDQLAYVAMSFALLLLIAYRSVFDHGASWELMGIVLFGGAVATAYRAWRRVVTGRAAVLATLAALVAGTLAILTVIAVAKLLA
jgi:hypothetical protein